MAQHSPQQLRFDQLLCRYFIWQLGVGAAVWTVLLAVFNLYKYAQQRDFILYENFYASSRVASLHKLANNTLETTWLMLLFGLLPAVVGGLLRQPLLAALSRRACTAGELVWKSLALFELSVFILALIPWPTAYNTFGLESFVRQFLVLSAFSLPWLLSTGLASRRLGLALLATPATGEATNRPTWAN